jgi:Flp pilus assembly protein TadD
MIGLLFIVLEFLRRVDVRRVKWMAALAAVLIVAAIATEQRNAVWTDPVLLWEDTVAKSPNMFRDQFQLAEAYRARGDCSKSLPHFARAAQLDPTDDSVLVDWGLAYDCLNQPDQALVKLQQAAAMRPTGHTYSQIGMVYGKHGRNAEAIEALQTAIKLNPGFDVTYVYLGGVHGNMGDFRAAIADFQMALAINPRNETAAQALATAQAALANRR